MGASCGIDAHILSSHVRCHIVMCHRLSALKELALSSKTHHREQYMRAAFLTPPVPHSSAHHHRGKSRFRKPFVLERSSFDAIA